MMAVDRRLWMLGALLVAMLVTPAWAGGGDVNLFVGQKRLSDDTLKDLEADEPTQFGAFVSLDFNWPVALALDLMSSSDDSSLTDTEGLISSTVTTDVDILEFVLVLVSIIIGLAMAAWVNYWPTYSSLIAASSRADYAHLSLALLIPFVWSTFSDAAVARARNDAKGQT